MALSAKKRASCALLSAAVLAAIGLTASAPASADPEPAGYAAPDLPTTPNLPTTPELAPSLVNPVGQKYLGLADNGIPQNVDALHAFANRIGKTPNLLEYYASFKEDYNATAARNAWDNGALTLVSWEPWTVPVSAIAAGKDDGYLRKFATEVRNSDIPVALNFGHEMNGFWYPWGPDQTKPADFVRAYRHIHDVFTTVGATKVIWVWSPNIVNYFPKVKLAPLYPGDAYVDWVGVSGYNEGWEHWKFSDVFDKTLAQMRAFTSKPALITETGVDATADQATRLSGLFDYVAKRPDVIGFVYFDYNQRLDWRLEPKADTVAAFRQGASDPLFGFDVREAG
jgi:mannan endo-1,4-beta-mannosidase